MWDIYYEHGEIMPSEERSLTFDVTLGEETFSITTLSNSTITNFSFSQTLKQVSFNVTGLTGTTGFSNVTIPDSLLWGEFVVYKDGSPLVRDVDYTQTYNGTHFIFYITYIHSTHLIEIRGTEVIDVTPPAISILSPENKTYSVNSVQLTFTVNESTSWIAYSLNGQANVPITGNTTLTELSDGLYSLKVYANDTAGNTGASDMIYFTIDTQQSVPFPIWIVAVIVIVAAFVTAIYLLRIRKTKPTITRP